MQKMNEIPVHKRIGALFAFLGKNFEFTTEKAKIHNTFFKLSNLPEYRELFYDIHFSSGGEYYKSDVIEKIMDNLVFSRLLSAKNPDLIKYQMSDGLFQFYSDEFSEKFPSLKEQVKSASSKFKELIED